MISDRAPSLDEVEYSVFGPGYGESILVHATDNDWFVVDSCLNPLTKNSAPLEYLSRIGVDPGTAVRMIVVTHWHDDHIRGIAELVDACPCADVVISQALHAREFTTLLDRFRETPGDMTGIDEFRRVLNRDRTDVAKRLKYAISGRPLWDDQTRSARDRTVTALSPTDAAVTRGIEAFAKLGESHDPRRRLLRAPNDTSVALSLEIGSTRALLGADLEAPGWLALLESKARPHHGSAGANVDAVWKDLLIDQPLAVVTPFPSQGLPTTGDVNRICRSTSRAFITSNFARHSCKDRKSVVAKMIRAVTVDFREQSKLGHVRLRCPAHATDGTSWTVELSPDAKHLVPVL